MKYDTVVRPRVRRILKTYPDATTTSAFWELLQSEDPKDVLSWSDDEKPNRVLALTEFLLAEGIETEHDLGEWISSDQHWAEIQQVRGVGPKTADYVRILAGMQTAAVDRYGYRLLEDAGIEVSSYEEAKEILNLAADTLGIERALFDHSIWKYMSTRSLKGSVKRRDDSSGRTADCSGCAFTPAAPAASHGEIVSSVRGRVTGLSQFYSDGLERMEIWTGKSKADKLPYVLGRRVPVDLEIDGVRYRAGLRATEKAPDVWICPDIRNAGGEKVRLAEALIQAGFEKNDPVELLVAGRRIRLS